MMDYIGGVLLLAWFVGPFEGGLDLQPLEFGGCLQTLRLAEGNSSSAFMSNLARHPVRVFVRGSRTAGFEMLARRGRVCLDVYNRAIFEFDLPNVPGIRPSYRELVQWALRVFENHGVRIEGDYAPGLEGQVTWSRFFEVVGSHSPQGYDPSIVAKTIADEGHPVPQVVVDEIARRNAPDAGN